jgi:FG-GAP-like repeat
MPRSLSRRLGAALATIPLLAGMAVAQSFSRTDVTNSPTHLIMNGNVPKTDANEVDFLAIDIDMDGDVDVVVGRKTPFTSSVNGLQNVLLMNDGAGHLTDETATYTPFNNSFDRTREVDSGDMNNDGWPDVITFQTEDEPTKIFLNLGNDAAGNWLGLDNPINVSFGNSFNICGGAVVDFDLDGKLDIYRVNYSSNANPSSELDDLLRQTTTPSNYTDMLSMIPNVGTSTSFGGGQLTASDANFGTRVQTRNDQTGGILDINGDGFVDILVTGREKMRIAYTDGAGGFLASQEITPGNGGAGNDVYDGVAADFDNDGRVDFWKVRDGTDLYNLNVSTNPNGTINQSASASPSSTNGFGANVRAVDFDSDGDLDVFVASIDPDIPNCNNNSGAKLFENTGASGAGRFVRYTAQNVVNSSTFDFAFADFDGDGIVDMLASGCGSTPGYNYRVSDPNAVANTFSSEFVPLPNGAKIFTVSNIPATGGARRLYNFFDTNTSYPLGTGAFIGLDPNVIGQVQLGFPFIADITPTQDTFEFTISAFAVQAIPVVRQRTALVDFITGSVDLTEVIEEN